MTIGSINIGQRESIDAGQQVQVLYPEYATYLIGTVVGPEQGHDGRETGKWLIQVESSDLVLALAPDEFTPLNEPLALC